MMTNNEINECIFCNIKIFISIFKSSGAGRILPIQNNTIVAEILKT